MKKAAVVALVFCFTVLTGIVFAQQSAAPAPAPAAPAAATAAPAAAPAPAAAAPTAAAPSATPAPKAAAPAPAPAAPAPAPATPAPAKATAPAAAPAAAGLTIARMEIAANVENREPVGIAASFPATQEKVSCFLEFQNVKQESTVNVVWTMGANEMGKVPLKVKALSKFRTWANKSIGGMKGDWKVEVMDESGAVLKSAAFKIE